MPNRRLELGLETGTILDSRAGYSGRVGCPKLNSAVRGRAEITAVTARSGQMRRDTRWPDRAVESRPRPPRRRRAPRPQIWERRAEFSVFGVRCEGADGIRTDKHTTTNLSSRAVPNLAPRNKKSSRDALFVRFVSIPVPESAGRACVARKRTELCFDRTP